jgi:RNA polymerase sigma factor (sigma-70 family)
VVRLGTWSGSRGGLARFGAPHPRDFGRFYEAYYPRILRYFAYHTRDPQLSLDLTAESFAKAFAAREKFRGTTSKEAVGWLWGIARNELRHHARDRATEGAALRRLGLSRPVANDEELARVIELIALDDQKAPLYDAFDELTDKQREVVQLRVIEELSYPEIASRLGVSQVIARKRGSAALRRLADNGTLQRLRSPEE